MDGNNKKKRSANLQQTEKELLVDLVTKYHAIIECKAADVASVKCKNDAWTKLADEFNSVTCAIVRDGCQLRHVCITSLISYVVLQQFLSGTHIYLMYHNILIIRQA